MNGLVQWILGGALAASAVAVPVAYQYHQSRAIRNFKVVEPGVLYRSGQLTPRGLEQVISEYGIRTVVTFREQDGKRTDPSWWEDEFCARRGVVHVRIPPRAWEVPDGPPPVLESIDKYLEVINNPDRYPRPILIHCFGGVHRAGAYTAIYRMEVQHWSNSEAIAEMQRCGYTVLEEDIGGFMWNYVPTWKRPPAATPSCQLKPD